MAGETIKSEAICLDIRSWSRTSHVTSWLTPTGKVTTLVKGAARPKSAFLGQYDLNYTCEIVYYARAKGELHALRECVPVDLHERLRGDYRALALAGYLRQLTSELAPQGAECGAWYGALKGALARTEETTDAAGRLGCLIAHELKVLEFSGLKPDFSGFDETVEWCAFALENGAFLTRGASAGGRTLRVMRETGRYLSRLPSDEKNKQILLDATRLLGVYYTFHLDCAVDVRRTVLGLISENLK